MNIFGRPRRDDESTYSPTSAHLNSTARLNEDTMGSAARPEADPWHAPASTHAHPQPSSPPGGWREPDQGQDFHTREWERELPPQRPDAAGRLMFVIIAVMALTIITASFIMTVSLSR